MKVTFKRAGIVAEWDGSFANLLELAEAHGILIPSSCRCGADTVCQTALLSGEVSYGDEPVLPPADGMCLPCVAVPVTDVALDA